MSRTVLTQALGQVLRWLRVEHRPHVVAGSLPRGVSVAQDQADVYVPMQRGEISSFLDEAEQRFCKFCCVRRCSRGLDYVILYNRGWSVDLVPVESWSDCSILHAQYFRGRSRQACVQVLEFKSLLKALGLYGADCAVEGFSGFLVELMVQQVGGPRRAHPLELLRFLGKPITDPCDPSRNLEKAVFKGHAVRLLLHLVSVDTGFGHLLRFKALHSPQRDFPGARRHLARMAHVLPLDVRTKGPYLLVRAPVLNHRRWVRRAVPLEAAARVTRPLFLCDQLCCYDQQVYDLTQIPGLVRL